MTTTNLSNLTAVTPIDGRYLNQTSSLKEYFSEYALIKTRVEIEIKYLLFLSEIGVAGKISDKKINILHGIYDGFGSKDAQSVKHFEEKTKHDVKSIEYFIGNKLHKTDASNLIPYIHFGLTSADINENAYRLMLKRALDNIIIPHLHEIDMCLKQIGKKYICLPMLARTHGQPAVPTTFGKEMLVFQSRLNNEIEILKKLKLSGKINGAVGNWNALEFAYPKINWPKESRKFLRSLGLGQATYTTQIAPPEDMLAVLGIFFRINSILLDFNQDMWRYISDDWVCQKGKEKYVGSSVMPQKVNPIEFENSEGNLIMSNGVIESLSRKLPISRLQRDLSDSTVTRNIGVIFAYAVVAYQSLIKGFATIEPNENKILRDLNENWSILSEAMQTILRKNGLDNAYEKIAQEVRGKKIDREKYIQLVKNLPIDAADRKKLMNLSPSSYLGYSNKLT